MAQQGEGWPMGLLPVNMIRAGLARNGEVSAGSASFNALLTSSPTSSGSSSDLDTESTGSFFHDRSITLGSLMGASRVLDLPRRTPMRGRKSVETMDSKKSGKPRRIRLLSLCSGEDCVDVESGNLDINVASSLGHFLAADRKATAANGNGRILSPSIYGPDEMAIAQAASGSSNSLFINGRIAPPPMASPASAEVEGGCESGFDGLLCCVCGPIDRK